MSTVSRTSFPSNGYVTAATTAERDSISAPFEGQHVYVEASGITYRRTSTGTWLGVDAEVRAIPIYSTLGPATAYYASTTGNDNNDGLTSGTPKTLLGVINEINSIGAVGYNSIFIYCAPGTYFPSEHIISDVVTRAVYIMPDTTLIATPETLTLGADSVVAGKVMTRTNAATFTSFTSGDRYLWKAHPTLGNLAPSSAGAALTSTSGTLNYVNSSALSGTVFLSAYQVFFSGSSFGLQISGDCHVELQGIRLASTTTSTLTYRGVNLRSCHVEIFANGGHAFTSKSGPLSLLASATTFRGNGGAYTEFYADGASSELQLNCAYLAGKFRIWSAATRRISGVSLADAHFEIGAFADFAEQPHISITGFDFDNTTGVPVTLNPGSQLRLGNCSRSSGSTWINNIGGRATRNASSTLTVATAGVPLVGSKGARFDGFVGQLVTNTSVPGNVVTLGASTVDLSVATVDLDDLCALT